MSAARRIAFGAGGATLFALLVAGMRGLPPLGGYSGVYGALLDEVAVGERHATDIVSAVNFDYRAFDTMGEEFILFTAVIGVAMLLRQLSDEREERPRDEDDCCVGRRLPREGDAVRVMAIGLVAVNLAFGGYIVSHGVPTPGGGFQGGVVLATAPLVVYLAAGPKTFRRLAPETLIGATEAAGAAGYILIGALALVLGRPFLTNVLPLGEPGTALSGGTIFALNVTVGVEVAAALVLMLLDFERQALEKRMKGPR